MQAALNDLGFSPTWHGFDLTKDASLLPLWNAAADAKFHGKGSTQDACSRQAFDKLLGNYAAVCDIPPVFFAEELIRAYPEAKVILVARDFNSWFPSFKTMIDAVFGDTANKVVEQGKSESLALIHKLYEAYFKAAGREGIFRNAEKVYKEHNDRLREIGSRLGQKQFLEYELGSGWEPLCEFLHVKVPNMEFPQMNTREGFAEQVEARMQDRLKGNLT